MAENLSDWPTGRLLSTAARRVEREWDLRLEQWSLSHASFPVLFLLSRSDHSQRELAEATGVTEQTMSRMLVRLEDAGYLTRRRHATDRRRHVVALLPAGRRVVALASDPRPLEAMATRGLRSDQVDHLRDALVAMLADNGTSGSASDGDPPAGPDDASDGPA